MEHIDVELCKVPHPSADTEEAMKALHNDTKEKVANVYAKVIIYGDLKENLPAKLKISAVAMIPHKSRSYHTILDPSLYLRQKMTLMQSVNSARVKHAPEKSMIHLG